MFVYTSLFTLIFQVLEVVVPVSEASSEASVLDPSPASTYICSPSLIPQIFGRGVPLVEVVPVLAFVA